MEYRDLRDFIAQLEKNGDLKRISQRVDPNLEITEISDRVLRAGGPALLFEQPGDSNIPLLSNLFGTERRVAQALGEDSAASLRDAAVESTGGNARAGAGALSFWTCPQLSGPPWSREKR